MNWRTMSWLAVMGLAAAPVEAGEVVHYPTGASYSNWPTTWSAISSLNDGLESGTPYLQLDFVGDASDPGAYWASDSTHLYFRMRTSFAGTVSTGGSPTFADSIFLYIDRVGQGYENGMPDFALAWNSKGNINNHGLELVLPPGSLPSPATWMYLIMNDLDGNVGQKISPPDINSSGDGYVRTVDGVATASFGTTTYVDFAVRLSYLESNHLFGGPGETWRLALGSVHDQTDHAAPNVDIAGSASVSSPLTGGWSAQILVGPPGGGS